VAGDVVELDGWLQIGHRIGSQEYYAEGGLQIAELSAGFGRIVNARSAGQIKAGREP
jgi:hypothetical protein